MKTRNIVIIAVVAVLIIIQFFRPSFPDKKEVTSNDMLVALEAPEEVATLVKQACYDCHSLQYEVPWYGKFAPTSWIVGGHIHEGLEELNMSEFRTYKVRTAHHLLEEMVEMISEGEMPLRSYKIIHPKARLTDEEKALLVDFFSDMVN